MRCNMPFFFEASDADWSPGACVAPGAWATAEDGDAPAGAFGCSEPPKARDSHESDGVALMVWSQNSVGSVPVM